MRALIPAAGMATRLRPLTEHCPKCLLPVGNRTLLERALSALDENGIRDITICTGYLAEQIREYVSTHFPHLHVNFVHNERYETTNNIYSLYLMRADAEGQDVLLLDSDILFDPSILQRLLQSPDQDTLALNNHPLGEEEIKGVLGPDKKVREISKVCSISEAVGE